MDIRQTLGTVTVPAAPAPSEPKTAAPVNSDFEVFLQMLTAQMKYQDPLNPVDSTNYATQLATFSGVEQAVLTNDLMSSMATQLGAGGLAVMAAWVGKEARAAAPAYFDGQPIMLSPKASQIAESAEVVVGNDVGVEVQRMAISPGVDTVDWVGVGTGGAPMPNGLYSFEVVSTANGEVIARDPIEVYSKVTEVRIEAGQTTLILQGGASVPSDKATALRDPLS